MQNASTLFCASALLPPRTSWFSVSTNSFLAATTAVAGDATCSVVVVWFHGRPNLVTTISVESSKRKQAAAFPLMISPQAKVCPLRVASSPTELSVTMRLDHSPLECEGAALGVLVGPALGFMDGGLLGVLLGNVLGQDVGCTVGCALGWEDGSQLG